MAKFDPLTATAAGLQRLLESQLVSSVEIVDRYLDQIHRYNQAGPQINALLAVAPRHVLLSTAMALDEEREQGKIRGPLHGIPVILKDNIMTHPELGMPTTAGSWAFVNAKPKNNAALVKKLLNAGMIIIAKGNMTEFSGLKTRPLTPGQSSYGGITKSPFVGGMLEGDTILGHSAPGGSSVGSAMGIAAGFAPLSIGTDTVGSIVTPSNRAGLYGLRPTLGSVDMGGVFGLSPTFDIAGPMAKSVKDLISLTHILLETPGDFNFREGWSGLSIGSVEPELWRISEDHCKQHEGTFEQMNGEYKTALDTMRQAGAEVKYPIVVPDPSVLVVEDESPIKVIAFWEFKNICVPSFVNDLEDGKIHTIEDIVKFNEKHSKFALPEPHSNQDDLIESMNNSDTEEKVVRFRRALKQMATAIIDRIFNFEELDLILAPADSPICSYASSAGYPLGTVPLGALNYNGRPFGMCVLAKANCEHKILHFMSAFEKSFPQKAEPLFLKIFMKGT